MKKDLSAYPSGEELAQIAGMSPARYQLAFRKYYGTTPYEYLKEMRLNQALFLLKTLIMGLLRLPQRLAITIQAILQSYLKMPMVWGQRNTELIII